jgi:hypothetical protein
VPSDLHQFGFLAVKVVGHAVESLPALVLFLELATGIRKRLGFDLSPCIARDAIALPVSQLWPECLYIFPRSCDGELLNNHPLWWCSSAGGIAATEA